MTAEREEHEPYYNPDGDIPSGPIPAQITIRTDKPLGNNPENVFARLTLLKKHKRLYDLVKRFQDEGNDVRLQANAHKGVILTAILIGTGVASGVLVKKTIERRNKK